MRFAVIASALIFAGTSVLASAPLSWESCVRQASEGNSELTAARSSLQSSDFLSRGAYSGYLPQVSAGLNYTRGSTSSNGGAGVDDTGYTASLTATENLFSGLSDRAKVEEARANRAASEAGLATVRAKVSFDLKSAFIGLIYAQELIRLTQDISRRREANLKMVELRFDTGHENKGSLLLSKAYFADAGYAHFQAVNAVDVARAQLARVLGREDDEELEVSGTVPEGGSPEALDMKALALLTPDYLQAAAQEAAADAAVTIARAPFFPVLSLIGTNNDTGNAWFPGTRRWAVGAALTWSIFNGGRDYYATRSAAEIRNAAGFTRANTLRADLTRLRQTHAAYLEAQQKLVVDRSFEEAATTRAKIAREKYNNGLLTFEDWDIIENDLISREKSRLQSEKDRVVAEAAWEQAQGKGVIP